MVPWHNQFVQPTTTPNAQEATMFLTPGSILPEGVVVQMTLTSYEVETPSGATVFVPFGRVHPTQAASPLVIFG